VPPDGPYVSDQRIEIPNKKAATYTDVDEYVLSIDIGLRRHCDGRQDM